MDELNPLAWFGQRELPFAPKHFILANTQLTVESKQWILNNLKGRFSCIHKPETVELNNFFMVLDSPLGNPAFEDPAEATLYELKWS